MSDVVELKLKRKVQIIVISAMSLFFVLATVVVFQFAIQIHQRSQVKAYTKENAAIQRKIDQAKEDTKYFDSDEFVYDYAVRYLNRGRPNDKIFI